MSSGLDELRSPAAQLVGDALDSRVPCVIVEGEAGIGKTTLLNEVSRERSDDVAVLTCVSRPSDELNPFSSIVSALRTAVRDSTVPDEPAARFESLVASRASSPRLSPMQVMPDDRIHMIEGLVTVLVTWSHLQPVLLSMDDLQWVDDASLAVLERIVDTSHTHSISVLTAVRYTPRSELLDAFLARSAAEGALAIRLEPLEPDEVADLLETLFRAPAGPALVEAADAAGGNPFLLRQLADAWERAGVVHIDDGIADLNAEAPVDAVAADIHGIVLARMAGFDADLRRALVIGAALGRSFSVAELAAVLRQSPTDTLPVIERALHAGLLVEDQRRLRFQHDLVSDAVLATLPEGMRAALHRDIADALRDAGASAARIAPHLGQGAERGDMDAVRTLESAAQEIVVQSPGAAADLLDRALDLCPMVAPERDVLLADLVDASFWCGRLDAMPLAEEVLGRAVEPAIRNRVLETVSRSLALGGRPAEAVERAAAIQHDGEQSAWSLSLTATFRLFAMDLDGALADAAVAVEQSADDTWAETLALGVQCFTHVALGNQYRAVEFGEAAVAAANRSPNLEAHRMMPLLFYGMALENACRSDDARLSFQRGERMSEEFGMAWSVPFFHYGNALAHWGAGRWEDILAECRAGLDFAGNNDVTLAAGFAYGISAIVHLFQRELDEAERLLDAGDAIVARGGLQYGVDFLVWVRALHLEATGNESDALELLRGAAAMAEGLQARAALSLFGPDLVRLAVLAGEIDSVRDMPQRLERRAGDEFENLDAHVERVAGLLAGDVPMIVHARDAHRHFERPVEVLFDDEAEVLTLIMQGDRKQARDKLLEFVVRCDEIGCPGLGDRAVRGAERLGVTVTAPRNARAVSGWSSLTKTEQKVATLVAKGQSNLQIAQSLTVSPRTVESHLYRAFTKLGVTNRTELAMEVVAQGQA